MELTDIDRSLIKNLPFSYAKRYSLLPVRKEDGTIVVASSKPEDFQPIDDLRVLLNSPVKVIFMEEKVLLDLINRVYHEAANVDAGTMVIEELQELEETKDLLESADEAPVVRMVNSLLSKGLQKRASDIHFEPFERDARVRFRVDGILHEIQSIQKGIYPSVVSRVKVIAGMNVAEKRLPQDGGIRVRIAGKDVDIRASTIPTSFGERVVLRLLDRERVLIGLEDLGLSPEMLKGYERQIGRPHGILLITGPTGSGKTTSLYASLASIKSEEKNILTVEDPIEYQLKGIGQMQINPKVGLTFAKGLRHILRQDPDIIMVGEIRDRETAEMAIQAALTGHLVLSTLHTNDSAGAITRLVDMSIEPFLVSSSLIGVMAQRLVRVLCPRCKEAYQPTEDELALIGITPPSPPLIKGGIGGGVFYRKTGCEECLGTGYIGRKGIYELLDVDDDIRKVILQGGDSRSVRTEADRKGMKRMISDGADKVLQGVTSIEEVLRVTQEE
ncbi:MAG: type II secretion system ATPase GspE [Deltaproteobacteria bacterium]|nr:type II secretion system ATPase GspE [Deltaproteobacteria bacterium]